MKEIEFLFKCLSPLYIALYPCNQQTPKVGDTVPHGPHPGLCRPQLYRNGVNVVSVVLLNAADRGVSGIYQEHCSPIVSSQQTGRCAPKDALIMHRQNGLNATYRYRIQNIIHVQSEMTRF